MSAFFREVFVYRRSPFVLAVVLIFGAVPLVHAQKVEITPQFGYRFGGSMNDYWTGQTYDFNDSESYGLTVNYTLGLMGDTQLDFSWSRQDTSMDVFNLGSYDEFDMTIDQWQAGGLKQWHEDETVRPFLLGSLGATHFSPEGSELSSVTRFAFALGGGVKILPGRHVGVRFQGKLYGTYGSGSAGALCGPAGCAFGFNGNFMWQAEFSVGLILGIGDL